MSSVDPPGIMFVGFFSEKCLLAIARYIMVLPTRPHCVQGKHLMRNKKSTNWDLILTLLLIILTFLNDNRKIRNQTPGSPAPTVATWTVQISLNNPNAHIVRALQPVNAYLRLHPFVSKRREMPNPVPTKAFLQLPKAAAMCMAPRAETCPPPPIPPFLLAKNLSLKRIAPTDNMWPKLHDEYIHHQWLKGY